MQHFLSYTFSYLKNNSQHAPRKEAAMYNLNVPSPSCRVSSRQRVAKNLRFLRISNAMSQENVCERIGISRSQYSCLENAAKEVSLTQLRSLSLLYDISIEHLLSLDLSAEAMAALQENLRSIGIGSFQNGFLALSPQNRTRIWEELLRISKSAKGAMR